MSKSPASNLNVKTLADLWASPAPQHTHFDVIVVGSGYGGSVAAAMLAGSSTGLRIAMLERGSHRLPGEFPAQFDQLPGQVRVASAATGSVGGMADGLFDIRPGDDVVAMVASGVGGGSLINAGVMLEPDPADFANDPMMLTLVNQLKSGGHYNAASRALGGQIQRQGQWINNSLDAHPALHLAKAKALQSISGGQPFSHPPVTVSFAQEVNSAGVELPACNQCGDCLTGCNQGAKNSLDANLLALASTNPGFQIYTGASVLSVQRLPKSKLWQVSVVHTQPKLQSRETGPLLLTADKVILAAGSLGSTEILMRSRQAGLSLSPRLGERFSCNGDNISALYQLPVAANGMADEDVSPDSRNVGPTITSSISMPGRPAHHSNRGFKVQEFSVPGPMKVLAQELIATSALIQDLATTDATEHQPLHGPDSDPLAVRENDMAHALVVGIIGHDDASGVLELPLRSPKNEALPVSGVIRIHWPHARKSDDLLHSHQALNELLDKWEERQPQPPAKPRVIPNPMWNALPGNLKELVTQPYGPVLTVHPLGGCSMGKDTNDGVVDMEGRVFMPTPATNTSDDWFGSLVVLDGAILRGSLGVNPALTIAATAFRAMSQLVPAWTQNQARLPDPLLGVPRAVLKPQPTPPHVAKATEVEIVERLYGRMDLHMGHTLPQPCMVELTLAYQPFLLRPWLSNMGRSLEVSGTNQQSVIRIFKADTWETEQLRVKSDAQRAAHVQFEATVEGQLHVLNREASGRWGRTLRALCAWLRNRGIRDLVQRVRKPKPDESFNFSSEVAGVLSLASRAGEARLFKYELTVQTVLRGCVDDRGRAFLPLTTGSRIAGHKRLTYNRRANPWRQLTELTLTHMPSMASCSPRTLIVDPRFLAEQGLPLVRITQQENLVRAYSDFASLALWFTRLILSTHLWTFRKPDDPLDRTPQRLPGPIAGLPDPVITELVVGHSAQTGPVKVRLTHYRPPSPRGAAIPTSPAKPLPALVMIHGYSVSGNTFTHPSLAPSAAEFFCHQGRDVWVVDLRTSSGLPTATQPWSMEEVALVDIPAALNFARQASGGPVDVLAHCIGCVMLSMAMLATAKEVRNNHIRLGSGVYLDEAQLAALDAFNWRLPDENGPHPCVRTIILSQKGPVLRYTDENIFRGYLLQTLRRWVLTDGYQFRRTASPGVAEELVDRLLASIPYPDEEFDLENPCTLTGKELPWVGSRHRMDALYGRDFNGLQLSEDTLNAIDDLFGPINMETVAQTIHFTRFNTITCQRGRGEFVTPKRMHTRWHDVPTLAIHGKQNGLVDVSTQDLLTENMRKAGVPFRALSSDQAPYNMLGHQDVLIGTSSHLVFADMEAFLRGQLSTIAPPPNAPYPLFELGLPWLGPRHLCTPADTHAPLQVACMSHPTKGDAQLLLVPVTRGNGVFTCTSQGLLLNGPLEKPKKLEWLTQPMPAAPTSESHTGWLALIVYPTHQTQVEIGDAWPHSQAVSPQNVKLHTQDVDAWMATQPIQQLELAFLPSSDLARSWQTLTQSGSGQAIQSVAVCSCQYPAGLLDALPAGTSLNALGQEVDQGQVAAVLMLGDQIYSDATAGMADPTRFDELYEQPHESAYRFAPMRNLLRKVPAFTLPDDHEIRDNWEPAPHAVQQQRPHTHERNERMQQFGMRAWKLYQRMQHPGTLQDQLLADQSWVLSGVPVYMLDTRSGRQPRGSSVPAHEQLILSPTQFDSLEKWLQTHQNAVKYVATPSMLLPRRRTSAKDKSGHAYSDSWDGFPESMYRLFDVLLKDKIGQTVFLSGDEHHSLYAEVVLQRAGTSVKLVSIHSSGLYAPLPFANGRPDQLELVDTFELKDIQVEVRTTCAAPGDGFAVVTPQPHLAGGGMDLSIVFHKPSTPHLSSQHLVRLAP